MKWTSFTYAKGAVWDKQKIRIDREISRLDIGCVEFGKDDDYNHHNKIRLLTCYTCQNANFFVVRI